MIRTASANWVGPGNSGNGKLTTQSTVLNGTPYNYKTRFQDEPGTNPEELVAASHAGCFSMKFSFVIGNFGFTAEDITTNVKLNFEAGVVKNIHLELRAIIPGITEEKFQECALDAKQNCPISKLLNTEITMDAVLVNA